MAVSKPIKNKSVDPIEPTCKKKIYYTREDALEMIRHINETRITRELYAYQCPSCGFWHLTSKSHTK